jgi:hypothetical protein
MVNFVSTNENSFSIVLVIFNQIMSLQLGKAQNYQYTTLCVCLLIKASRGKSFWGGSVILEERECILQLDYVNQPPQE